MQNIVNTNEQEKRCLSLRVNGVIFSEDEKADNAILQKRVYDKVLQPILTLAKSSKKIDRVPSLANTITSCFRVRSASALTGTASPPPVVVKIASEQIRLAILQSKRRGIPSPSPSEVDMGIRHFSIQEDLTPQAYSLLRELKRREEVDRAWSISGKLRFTLTGSDRVHFVRSVYDKADSIVTIAMSKS